MISTPSMPILNEMAKALNSRRGEIVAQMIKTKFGKRVVLSKEESDEFAEGVIQDEANEFTELGKIKKASDWVEATKELITTEFTTTV